MHTILRTIRCAGLLVLLAVPALAAQSAAQRFTKRVEMVPMRDGTRLNTEIYVPTDHPGPLPVLVTRTPYGLRHDADGFHTALSSSYQALVKDGYVFVFQDIRGRFKSEGQFVMLRPPRDHGDPRAIDEGTDTYDTIDWVLKALPNDNGRVGMLGISYGGWLTVMAMLDPHPALKAVSPQASPADMWLGDDFHHNGAFRLSYGFEFATLLERSKEATPFEFTDRDTYRWFLDLGPLSTVQARVLGRGVPTWNDFVAHPDYDAFWRRQGVAQYLTRLTIPTLNVAGWWDQEDFYGPLKIYELLEHYDGPANLNRIVIGPWNHGGWARSDGSALGPIRFGTPTARHYQDAIEAPWFRHHLKGGADPRLAEATIFETGGNRWVEHGTWPPVVTGGPRTLYFHANGRLGFSAPADSGADAWVSDPAKPVPYRVRPILPLYDGSGSTWSIWLVDDQRHAETRPDVMVWRSEPLEADLVVAGNVVADLFVTTTGTDGDWVVKLIDEYPGLVPEQPELGGYQLMIANEVFRARYRASWERPAPMVAGRVTPLTIDLRHAGHRFRKGHRVAVQVQNSWFPLIDRNPQTFVPNILEAKPSDFRAATVTLQRAPRFPSAIRLPVLP